MSFHKKATKYLIFSSLLTSFAGFTFVFVAVIGPAWVIYDGPSSEWTLQEGIWMASFCEFKGRNCLVSSREEVAEHMDNKDIRFHKELDEPTLREFEALTTISLSTSFMCLSLVFATVVLKTLKRNRQFSVFVGTAIVSSTISWTVLLVPVIKVSHINRTRATFCWSWGLAVIGIVIEVFTSSFLFLAIVSNYIRTKLLNQQRAYRQKCFTMAVAYVANYSDGECLQTKPNFLRGTANIRNPDKKSKGSLISETVTSGSQRFPNSVSSCTGYNSGFSKASSLGSRKHSSERESPSTASRFSSYVTDLPEYTEIDTTQSRNTFVQLK